MKCVVVDMEFCKVPKGCRRKEYRLGRETIQIGAVLLDEGLAVVDKFCINVQPQYGFIDAEIKNLTGIRQNDVKQALVMSEALIQFADWLPDEDVDCVCWSDSDYRQMTNEMKAKNIVNEKVSQLFEGWIDAQVMFNKKIANGRNFNLTEAVIASDIATDVSAHNGLDDAYNTALLYAKLISEPDFQINEIYEAAVNNEPETLTVCIGDLLKGFTFLPAM